jgi:hypothetical protein
MMDLDDYGEVDDDNINEILKYCAFLRGTHNLMHRTLREFEWFIDACLFNRDQSWIGEMEIYGDDLREIYVTKFKAIYNTCDPDILLKYARLFKEYCYEIYVTRNTDDMI